MLTSIPSRPSQSLLLESFRRYGKQVGELFVSVLHKKEAVRVEAKFKREFTFLDVDGPPKELGPYGAVDPAPWESSKDYLDL